MGITCTDFKPQKSGCLLGFATIHVSSLSMTIRDCGVFEKGTARWVSMPARQYEDSEGNKRYIAYIYIEDEERRKEFSRLALKAVDEFCALQPEEAKEGEELPF